LIKTIFDILLEANRLAHSRSYRRIYISNDGSVRRPMSTIVELSAEQALTPTDDHGFDQEETRTSLSPLAQGIFI